MNQIQVAGDTIGYINFTPFLIGTPVIDAYYYKLCATRGASIAGAMRNRRSTQRTAAQLMNSLCLIVCVLCY